MVSSQSYAPRHGDVVWLTLNPQSGHEQAGRRPTVVLSPESYNRRTGLALFCPITGQVKGYPFEVRVPEGLPVTGVILSDDVKSLDWRTRRAELICTLPTSVVSEVVYKVGALLFAQGAAE